MNQKIESFLAGRNYKEISLFGYIYSFIIILSIAMIMDVYAKNHDDAIIEIFAILSVIALLKYLHVRSDIRLVSVTLMWIAALATFSLTLVNDFQHATPLFLWLVPFGFYLVLDRKIVFLHSAVYFICMALLFVYGYYFSDNRLLFDDKDALNGLFIGTLFVIAIGIFIYYAIEHSLDKLETSNREKEFLLKEIHHRVKNNLNMISSILALQSNTDDIKQQEMISRNRDRIHSIALVHEMLYQNERLDKIDVSVYIKNLSAHIIQANSKAKIPLHVRVSKYTLPLDSVIYLGLMLQEMLVNSLKYAFEDGGKIEISLEKRDNKMLFRYSDNGRGCSLKDLQKEGALGMELIEIGVEKLKATLTIENEYGLAYILEFDDV